MNCTTTVAFVWPPQKYTQSPIFWLFVAVAVVRRSLLLYIFLWVFRWIFLGYNLCVCTCVCVLYSLSSYAYVFNNTNTDRIEYRSNFSLDANDRFVRKFCINISNPVQMRWRSHKFNALAHSLIVRSKKKPLNHKHIQK